MKQTLLASWKYQPPGRRKFAAWTLGLLLAYTIVGFLILPWVIKLVAVKQLSSQLDRQVTIRQVRINPYVLSGTIRGLLVKDKDGEPFLSVEEAYANFQLSSFFGKHWVFKDIWAIKPYCRVQINKDYSLNFSDLAAKFSKPSKPSTKPKPSKPIFLHISRFQIKGASASFTDLTPSTPFHRLIGPVEIVLSEFHTDANNKNPYSFVGTTDSGEKFHWNGQFSLDPLQSEGELALEGLSIPKYAPLFQDSLRFEVKDGVVAGSATYRVTVTGTNYLATITNTSFNLKSFKLAEKDATNNVAELDDFSVTGLSADTVGHTANIAQVSLSGGRLSAKRNHDQTINLVQLSEPSEKSTNASGGILFLMSAATNAFDQLVRSTNLWTASLQKLHLTNCALEWEDLANSRPVAVRVDDFACSARNLSNIAGSNQTASLSFRWNTNGSVAVDSSLQLSPPSLDLSLDVKNLELYPLDPYLEPFLNLYLIDSKLGVTGRFQMRTGTNGLPVVTFHGDARMDDFATTDSQKTDLLKWKSVQLARLDANLQPPTIAIREIKIIEPFARVAFDTNQTLNFMSVLKANPTNSTSVDSTNVASVPSQKPAASGGSLGQKLGSILEQALAPAKAATSNSVMPSIEVAAITITNGLVQFNDRSVQPPVSSSFQHIKGTITGVSSEEVKRADLQLSMVADGTGPIEITGKINPLNQSAPTQLQVTFRDVDLSPESPYAGKFLGYRLNRGKLSLKVDYEVSQHQLKAKNVVTLDQLTLGEKVNSPDATKLPVRLAIAILKDRNGKIELDVPIEGDLNDPQFHFGKVIVHVLGTLITKMAMSPFAALGSLFGGKSEEASFQDFAPGESQVTTANQEKLQSLVNALYERPGLELQIEGGYDPATDPDALKKKKLEKTFREQKWAGLRKSEQARLTPDQVSLTPKEYAAYFQKAYAAVLKAKAATNALAHSKGPGGDISVVTAASSDLGDQRGAVKLVQKASPRRVVTPDDKARAVLDTIAVSEDEITQLGIDRAKSVQEKIIASGKIEATRVSLSDQPSTNRTTRVYFHLQ